MKAKRGNAHVRKQAERVEKFLTGNDDVETILTDLLVDAQHYAFTRNLDWFTILQRAHRHATTEQVPTYRGDA